jgi:hypothetical protein
MKVCHSCNAWFDRTLFADWKRASFFGKQFRNHRHLRLYATATRGQTEKKSSESVEHCFRKKESTRHLTSGLLTIFCPHGICHGFTLLKDAESERDVFQLFFTRCKDGRHPDWVFNSLKFCNRSLHCGV